MPTPLEQQQIDALSALATHLAVTPSDEISDVSFDVGGRSAELIFTHAGSEFVIRSRDLEPTRP